MRSKFKVGQYVKIKTYDMLEGEGIANNTCRLDVCEYNENHDKRFMIERVSDDKDPDVLYTYRLLGYVENMYEDELYIDVLEKLRLLDE